MKKSMLAALAVVTLGVAGCVSTVTEQNPSNLPAYRDRVEKRYNRPLNEVFEAAKRAVNNYGNITKEGSMFSSSNEVRILEASINQRGVWMRLEGVAPSVTSVTIQVRARMGGTDMQLIGDLQQGITDELPKK